MNLAVMQAVRLKGMATAEALSDATGMEPGAVAAALAQLLGAEDIQERGGRHRVTREGRDRLDAALAAERATIDATAVTSLYEEFCVFNEQFKLLVNRWQLRDGEPNEHTDAAYDGAVLADLDELHASFGPLAARAAAIVPRMAPYPARFEAALAKIRAGDHTWLLRPMIDSYHTVWFELHEDLIGLAGLTRLQEAAEGRAQ